jgi:hypothetical protein
MSRDSRPAPCPRILQVPAPELRRPNGGNEKEPRRASSASSTVGTDHTQDSRSVAFWMFARVHGHADHVSAAARPGQAPIILCTPLNESVLCCI